MRNLEMFSLASLARRIILLAQIKSMVIVHNIQKQPYFCADCQKPALPHGKAGSDCRQTLSGEKSLAEFFASEGEKSIQSVFSGDMRLGKNTSQPANVRASPASECAAAGCIPSVGKAFGLCRRLETRLCVKPQSLVFIGAGRCSNPS